MSVRAAWRPPPFVPLVRLMRIAWRMLAPLMTCALAALALVLLDAAPEVRRQVAGACLFVLGWAGLRALAREVLAPLRPRLRAVPLDDVVAHRVEAAVRLLLTGLLVTELGAWLVRVNHWAPVVATLLGMARNALLLTSAWAAFAWTGWARRAWRLRFAGLLGYTLALTVRVLLPLALLTALTQIVAHGLGYVPLAGWIARNVAWMALKFMALAWIYRFILGALRRTVSVGAARNAPTPAAIGAMRIGSGLLWLACWLGGGLWILAGWGLGPSVLGQLLEQPIFSGGSHTWGQALTGLTQVAFVLFLGWLARALLTFFVFPAASLDVGARYAILAVLRYVVGVVALVLAFSAVGFESSSLAWFLGAAGIGLGLGLQDVLGNFFSGLIMLLERPIRVGDTVLVGETLGTVEAIRIRGTLIRTQDNTTVIVPNRQMLGERLTNLSFRRDHGRVSVRVGVGYGSDPERVRRVLLDVARRHPAVLDKPEPQVQFTDFGASDLVFTLFAFSRDLARVPGVASELRFAVFQALKEAGIEIPFPQRDVNIRTLPPRPPAP